MPLFLPLIDPQYVFGDFEIAQNRSEA